MATPPGIINRPSLEREVFHQIRQQDTLDRAKRDFLAFLDQNERILRQEASRDRERRLDQQRSDDAQRRADAESVRRQALLREQAAREAALRGPPPPAGRLVPDQRRAELEYRLGPAGRALTDPGNRTSSPTILLVPGAKPLPLDPADGEWAPIVPLRQANPVRTADPQSAFPLPGETVSEERPGPLVRERSEATSRGGLRLADPDQRFADIEADEDRPVSDVDAVERPGDDAEPVAAARYHLSPIVPRAIEEQIARFLAGLPTQAVSFEPIDSLVDAATAQPSPGVSDAPVRLVASQNDEPGIAMPDRRVDRFEGASPALDPFPGDGWAADPLMPFGSYGPGRLPIAL